MISLFTNKIIITTFFSLSSNALLMLLFVDNNEIFLQLNYYLTAVLFAMIFDSLVLVRYERVFSKKTVYAKKILVRPIINIYLLYFIIIIILTILEYFIFKTFFTMIVFSRHIYNVSRQNLPYLFKKNYVPISSNILVVIRNICIIFLLYTFNEIDVILTISIISFCEILIMYRLFYSNYFKFNFIKKHLFLKKKTFLRKSTFVNLMQFLGASIDRLIIIILFNKEIEEIYFKYKLLQQYIDAGYSIFGYKIHLDIMMNNLKNLLKHLTLVFFTLQIIGVSIVLYIFDITLVKSMIIFTALIVFLALRRIFDSFVGAIAIKKAFYNLIIIKNLIEVLFVSLFILCLGSLFLDNIDKLYISIIAIQVSVSFSAFIYLKKKKLSYE